MWDEDKQGRLDDLQRRAQQDTLTDDEQRVLEQLLSELEQAEWTTLRPALDQQRREQGQLQAELARVQTRNAVLAALTERHADLLARARLQLAGIIGEREALRAEYERVLR